MNKKRFALALFFVAAMSLSMFMMPMAPIKQTETSTPSTFTPEQNQQIENFYQQVSQPDFKPGVDAVLAQWQDTGVLSDSVVSYAGRPSVLIYGAPWLDIESVRNVVHIAWWVNLKVFKLVQASVNTPADLDTLMKISGVAGITANTFIQDNSNQAAATPGTIAPDMTEFRDIVGATGSIASSYDGTGVVVGHVDTGADFGNPVLQHAYDSYSYDPTSAGVVFTLAQANSTDVANTTAWLEDGNVLTYRNATGVYMNITTDFDCYVNYNGLSILSPQYYVYNTGAKNKANATDFFEKVVWTPYQIPDPATFSINGNFHFGYVLQGKATTSGGAPRIFTPVLLWNSSTNNKDQVAVDWAGAEGWSVFFNGAWRYQTLDFNKTSTWATVGAMFDHSFVDDISAGEIYNTTYPVIAHDYTGDGIDDYSIGSLGYVYDAMGTDYYGDFYGAPYVYMFRPDGNAFGLYYDSATHGTATAALVAAKDVGTYYDATSNETFHFTGIAPGATILSTKAITSGSYWGSYLWVCGFVYNETNDEFYYSASSGHRADVVTNSWGWVTTPSSQFNYLDFTWEVLSQPNYLKTGYPGVLHVFSAGNEGSGYMTIGPPGSAASVLTVGASTSSKWLDYLYGPNQPYTNGVASFSSRGPSFSGYPKPDVMAPGLAGYSAVPWWGEYFVPMWKPGATYANSTLFSGTSQACPVAAGVVALYIQAAGLEGSGFNPASVKTVIQSTATPLVYDPSVTGFGLINADAACDYAGSGAVLVGSTTDSFNNFAAEVADAWEYWGTIGPYIGLQNDVNSSAVAFPTGYGDAALYFGQVSPGKDYTISYAVTDGTAGLLDWTGDSLVGGAMYYAAAHTYTFTGTTFSYNDTVVNKFPASQMYGYYNLRDELGVSTYNILNGYNYVTLDVAFNAAQVSGNEPWMFLYDWTDANHDAMPNLYNASSTATGKGNELARLTSASDASNVNEMQYAVMGTFGAVLNGNMTLVIHDPVFDTNMTAPGHQFTCTVVVWSAVDVGGSLITFADNGLNAAASANITLNVPANAETGIHDGIAALQYGSEMLMMPFSYNVVANVTVAKDTAQTIVDGWGADLSPYDNAAWGCMDSDPGTWDFRSYVITLDYPSAVYLGLRVIWPNTGNNMTVQVRDSAMGVIASGVGKTATTTAVIAKVGGSGTYYLQMHPTALNASVSGPVNFTIEAMWYETLTNQPVILSEKSNDRAGVRSVADGDTVWGDHVVLNASYPEFNLPAMPEFEIGSTRLGFLAGVYYQHTGNQVVPSASYDPYTGAPLDLTQFAFEYVPGIKAGDVVHVTCDFTIGDTDIFAYWASSDNSTWTYANDLMGNDMATGNVPETATFTADQSGTLVFAIFDYSVQAGQYTLTVDSRVGVYATASAAQVNYDTYKLGKNGTYSVQVYATTFTNLQYTVEYSNITFDNYFKPYMHTVSVSGSGAAKTITWTYSDLNAQDNHTFQVYISGDDGETYQLIATGITSLSYQWDSTGFTHKNYKAMVRVTDSYGLADQMASTAFDAGTVTITTATSTPPTTTTGVPPVDTTYLLWIGLIGGIGVGVVVVLILFLVKRK